MATKYGEDIAVLKQEMKDVKSVLQRIEFKLDNMPEQFITRREGNVIRAVLIILTAAVSAIAAVLLAVKK